MYCLVRSAHLSSINISHVAPIFWKSLSKLPPLFSSINSSLCSLSPLKCDMENSESTEIPITWVNTQVPNTHTTRQSCRVKGKSAKKKDLSYGQKHKILWERHDKFPSSHSNTILFPLGLGIFHFLLMSFNVNGVNERKFG